jgi:hypothetical protein
MSIKIQSTAMPRLAPRRKITGRQKFIVITVAAAFITTFGMCTDSHSPLRRWVAEKAWVQARDEIAPTMNPLAAAGKPDAVIWYAIHYRDAPLEPLRKLAEAGNGRALWVLAGITYGFDKTEAMRLARLAAEAGDPDAVRFELHGPAHPNRIVSETARAASGNAAGK